MRVNRRHRYQCTQQVKVEAGLRPDGTTTALQDSIPTGNHLGLRIATSQQCRWLYHSNPIHRHPHRRRRKVLFVPPKYKRNASSRSSPRESHRGPRKRLPPSIRPQCSFARSPTHNHHHQGRSSLTRRTATTTDHLKTGHRTSAHREK